MLTLYSIRQLKLILPNFQMLAWQFRVAYMPQSVSAAICSNSRIVTSAASQFPPVTYRFPLAIHPSVPATLSPSFEARLLIAFK